jgi:hypothetical protein
VRVDFIDPTTIRAARRRAIVIARHLAVIAGRKSHGRRADDLVTRMADRPTVRWIDLVRLDRLVPGALVGVADMMGVEQAIVQRACDAGAVETPIFIDHLGGMLEKLLIDVIGIDEARRRIQADFDAAYARFTALPADQQDAIHREAVRAYMDMTNGAGNA